MYWFRRDEHSHKKGASIMSDYSKLDGCVSPKNPRHEAGFLSLLTFWWIFDALKTGNKRRLETTDIHPLDREDESEMLTDRLEKLWDKEVERRKSSTAGLFMCLMRLFPTHKYCLLIAITLISVMANTTLILCMIYIVQQLLKLDDSKKYNLYICAGIIFLASITKSFSDNQMRFQTRVLVMRWRAALTGIIYKKLLQVNQALFLELPSGRIINIIAGDIQRLERAIQCFCMTIRCICDITTTSLLCWYFVGAACLMAVAVLLACVCYCLFLSKACVKLRTRSAEIGDRRIGLLNALVAGIRTVKMNGWEWPFRDQVQQLRRREVRILHQRNLVLSTIQMLIKTSKSFAILAALLALYGLDVKLSVLRVFLILILVGFAINAIKYLPLILLDLADSFSAIRRIQDLLKRLTEKACSPANSNSLIGPHQSVNMSHTHVWLNNVSFYYGGNSTFVLRNITLHVKEAELLTVVGKVGSGKTSLLLSILGELPLLNGHRSVKGNMLYVPQQPWVFSASLRDNILFGEEYIESKYMNILEACDLSKDMQCFPDGDMTIIGERGVMLSGGQRLRVGLARALYADADIYLLDDPLSAVDTEVGRQLYDKCIRGILQSKAVILVTHQLQYLDETDNLLLMRNGEIAFKGKRGAFKGADISEVRSCAALRESSTQSQSDFDVTSDSLAEAKPTSSKYKGLITEEEEREVTGISVRTYVNYITSGIPGMLALALLMFFIGVQALVVFSDWLFLQIPGSLNNDIQLQSHNPITIYGSLVAGMAVLTLIREFAFLLAALNASKNLHKKMLVSVLKSHISFFDTTPTGRILNRFSRDISVMDDLLPVSALEGLGNAVLLLAGLVVPVVLDPWLLIFIIPLLVPLVFIGRFYVRPSNDLIRHECIHRSPLFSHVTDTMEGLLTVKTHGMTDSFLQRLHRFQNEYTKVRVMMLAPGRWLAVCVDCIGALFTAVVLVAAFATKLQAGAAALSFIYAIQATYDTCHWTMQQAVLVENYMTSVERVMSYSELESEPGYETTSQPPEEWPRDGSLRLRNLSLKYHPDAPEILKGIDLDIQPREQVGIAGRTGAGKSSLVAALLRMPEPQGSVIIDGIDTKSLNIQSSRRAMSVIPQDPVLFNGTLRINLDPFERFSDSVIWRMLEESGLKSTFEAFPDQLDQEIQESGGNLSSGERQLVCLTRALLQQSKIIVLDEATAHVDYKTDALIQKTIRSKFKDCTVITIAHRLQTIMDYDRILVLDDGKVVACGSPETIIPNL